MSCDRLIFFDIYNRRRDLANDVDDDTSTTTRSRFEIRSIHVKFTRVWFVCYYVRAITYVVEHVIQYIKQEID